MSKIVEMARQAGFDPGSPAVEDWLERFAALVGAAKKEECAKAAQEYCRKGRSPLGPAVAAAIRALGDEVQG